MSGAVLRQPTGGNPVPTRFTAEAYLDMRAVLNRLTKTELLDGVICTMAADGHLTRLWNRTLAEWLILSRPREVAVVSHQTLPLGSHWAPSPDHYLFPESVADADVRGQDVLLVIEVSDTTLAYDLGAKAQAYAAHGVREYWVVDPEARCVHVHLLGEGAADGYGPARVVAFDEAVSATLIPGLILQLSALRRLS
jgi:Uma2 family endonuclease